MLKDLVKSCRSYRRFYEDISIPQEELTDMIDTVRLTGCTANCQPLKYRIIRTPEECAAIFPSLSWAGALKDWDGPEKGERPSAYIVILCDLTVAKINSGMRNRRPDAHAGSCRKGLWRLHDRKLQAQ